LVNEENREKFCDDLVESPCGLALVEVILSKWKIDGQGKLRKIKEVQQISSFYKNSTINKLKCCLEFKESHNSHNQVRLCLS